MYDSLVDTETVTVTSRKGNVSKTVTFARVIFYNNSAKRYDDMVSLYYYEGMVVAVSHTREDGETEGLQYMANEVRDELAKQFEMYDLDKLKIADEYAEMWAAARSYMFEALVETMMNGNQSL